MQRTTDSVELDAQPSTEPRHEGMAGLAKGLAIIEAFAVHDVMSVADAARASGATRAAARRCLLTLNVSPTGIISCVGGRDPAAEERLNAALARSRLNDVRSLRRAPDEPDETCWLAGEGWWLSTAGVNGSRFS